MSKEGDLQSEEGRVAAHFRAEIHTRFEAHNAAFRAKEAAELAVVLLEHPEKRGIPGYDVQDSVAWEVYQASAIQIDQNAVTIVLPSGWAFGADIVHLFDHTSMAWSSPTIGATIVDSGARVTIQITLLAEWPAEMEAPGPKRVLADLYEADIHELCSLVATHGKKDLVVCGLQGRLLLALEPLP